MAELTEKPINEIEKREIVPDSIDKTEIEDTDSNIALYEIEENEYILFLEDEEEYKKTNIIVRRVPQYILGANILGRAYLGSNYIEISARLFGSEYTEVEQHERNHLMHPYLPELEIRYMTKNQIGVMSNFH